MNDLGSKERPLRVAIVGSGPSGFYTTEALFKTGISLKVDMFERLPTPFGLVRYGVAPDHPKIKNVTKIYEKTAEHKEFSFFGNVHIGKDLNLHQLRKFYDAVIFSYGTESDRKLGIQGEELKGSHTATEFVAWYNGHPEHAHHNFDLSGKVAVIIGHGNVALDIARILCKTVDELKATDISQHALEVLAQSKIKEVHLVGRRGPIQAAFSPLEIRELGELADCDPIVKESDLKLNYSSQHEMEEKENAPRKKNYDILTEFAERGKGNKSRKCYVRFLESPAAIGGKTKVEKVFLEKNELIGEPGHQKSKSTGEKETLACDIFFRSVGYRGIPIPSVPYKEAGGIIPNTGGRVEDAEQIFSGLYCVGWIKRGPSGIIGTNKPDAEETVHSLMQDLKTLNPCKNPSTEEVIKLMENLKIRYITFDDWKKVDAAEIERGKKVGKPREKFVSTEEMLKIIGK